MMKIAKYNDGMMKVMVVVMITLWVQTERCPDERCT